MPGVGAILLTAVALLAVALLAWILAAGMETGIESHRLDKMNEDGTEEPRSVIED